MLTKRHFETVAHIVKGTEDLQSPDAVREEIADRLAELFSESNPRFDAARFMQACGVEPDIPQSRQTSCKHCGQDIENIEPFPAGQWRDRGNNPTCPNSAGDAGQTHEPVEE